MSSDPSFPSLPISPNLDVFDLPSPLESHFDSGTSTGAGFVQQPSFSLAGLPSLNTANFLLESSAAVVGAGSGAYPQVVPPSFPIPSPAESQPVLSKTGTSPSLPYPLDPAGGVRQPTAGSDFFRLPPLASQVSQSLPLQTWARSPVCPNPLYSLGSSISPRSFPPFPHHATLPRHRGPLFPYGPGHPPMQGSPHEFSPGGNWPLQMSGSTSQFRGSCSPGEVMRTSWPYSHALNSRFPNPAVQPHFPLPQLPIPQQGRYASPSLTPRLPFPAMQQPVASQTETQGFQGSGGVPLSYEERTIECIRNPSCSTPSLRRNPTTPNVQEHSNTVSVHSEVVCTSSNENCPSQALDKMRTSTPHSSSSMPSGSKPKEVNQVGGHGIVRPKPVYAVPSPAMFLTRQQSHSVSWDSSASRTTASMSSSKFNSMQMSSMPSAKLPFSLQSSSAPVFSVPVEAPPSSSTPRSPITLPSVAHSSVKLSSVTPSSSVALSSVSSAPSVSGSSAAKTKPVRSLSTKASRKSPGKSGTKRKSTTNKQTSPAAEKKPRKKVAASKSTPKQKRGGKKSTSTGPTTSTTISSSVSVTSTTTTTSTPTGTVKTIEQCPLVGDSAVDVGLVMEVTTTSDKEVKRDKMYKKFATCFKAHRIKLGYSLEDVIQQLAIRYGQMVALQYIQGFEDMILSSDSYGPLMKILQNWVRDTAKASGTSDRDLSSIVTCPSTMMYPQHIRKQRTIVSTQVTLKLEDAFSQKKNPLLEEIQHLAKELGVDKEYVRTWFNNRRRKEKIIAKEKADGTPTAQATFETINLSANSTLEGKPVISSPFYDITVVVPPIDFQDAGPILYAADCT